MKMKYLKWLNMIPLIMFFIVDKLRGTLISRYLLIIIVVLGVINMLIAKGMKAPRDNSDGTVRQYIYGEKKTDSINGNIFQQCAQLRVFNQAGGNPALQHPCKTSI